MPNAPDIAPRVASILCPIDFSSHAKLALRYAAALARRGNSSLSILFVNDPLLVAAAAAAYDSTTLGAATRAELAKFVARTLSPGAVRTLRLDLNTTLGKAPRAILAELARGRHDVVVVGARGLSGVRRLLLGSTTTGLLRHSPVPVLAVPAPEGRRVPAVTPAWPGRAIVAAIELGGHAEHDVRRAAAIARWFKATLVLVHVVPIPQAPSWMPANLDEQVRRRCARAKRALDALAAQVADVKPLALVRTGHPPDEIAAVASALRAGLVVMALRGRTGLFGEPAGSCAYEVLCHGVAPVLELPDARAARRRSPTTRRARRGRA